MGIEGPFLSEAFPAHGTRERPLAGVGPLVRYQLQFSQEGFPALGTSKPPLSEVYLFVRGECKLGLEGLATLQAGKRTLARVDPLVDDETFFPPYFLPAVWAGE